MAEKRGLKRLNWIALVAAFFVSAPLGSAIAPAEEALTVPDADQSAGPARRTDIGFEFRRKLAIVDNRYCDADNIARKAAED